MILNLDRYPGSTLPSAYSSDVKIYDKETNNSFEYTIFMNNVLDYRGYRFFNLHIKQMKCNNFISK